MDRLFITTKDRPAELAITCKSLLHSDIGKYISEVVFLDDNSEDIEAMYRIYSAFMHAMLARGIKTRWLESRDGREGINQSWERIRHYPCNRIWMLNGDMMVFSNYFERCSTLLDIFESKNTNSSVIVSGFDFKMHRPVQQFLKERAIKTKSVGGCSEVVNWRHLDKLMSCFGIEKAMNRGWDLHIGDVFDEVIVTSPTASQHLGIFSGLNQLHLSGFPGAWADIRS